MVESSNRIHRVKSSMVYSIKRISITLQLTLISWPSVMMNDILKQNVVTITIKCMTINSRS